MGLFRTQASPCLGLQGTSEAGGSWAWGQGMGFLGRGQPRL